MMNKECETCDSYLIDEEDGHGFCMEQFCKKHSRNIETRRTILAPPPQRTGPEDGCVKCHTSTQNTLNGIRVCADCIGKAAREIDWNAALDESKKRRVSFDD